MRGGDQIDIVTPNGLQSQHYLRQMIVSDLLSMPFMRDLIDLLGAMGERARFKVMVGGAAVTPEFAARIGADGTASNAVQAVQLARRLIREQRAAPGGPR